MNLSLPATNVACQIGKFARSIKTFANSIIASSGRPRHARIMLHRLPPRERQVAEIVHQRGEASATEIRQALPEPLSNGAVRSMLSRLQSKGVVRRRRDGIRYVYLPAGVDPAVREAVLRRVSRDFFDGSLARAADAMIALRDAE